MSLLGFRPSCPPLCLYRPVSHSLSVSSSRQQCLFSHMFFFRFVFFVLFVFIYLRLILICSSILFIFPVTSTFLSRFVSLRWYPLLFLSFYFFLSFLFVFLSSSVLILVIFLCTLYFYRFGSLSSFASLLRLYFFLFRHRILLVFSSACPACPEIPFFYQSTLNLYFLVFDLIFRTS